MKHEKLLIIIICFVGFLLRIYNIDSVPPSASLDEASIGWNAYSILKTGRDEYGTFLPFVLRAYDDWRPALYAYLVIPFITLFGLDAAAVRLPSVLLSVFTIPAVFLIAKKIRPGSESVAAFLVAISPWSVYLSRLGHEANLGYFLFIWGVYYLLSYLKDIGEKDVMKATILLILSIYGYQSEKVIVPVLCIILLPFVFRHSKKILPAAAVGLLLLIPFMFQVFGGKDLTRFAGTSAFNTDNAIYTSARASYVRARDGGIIFDRLYFSEPATSVRIFMSNYLSHMSPKWLFTGADRESHKVPGMGLLYYWELPFLLIGIYVLLRFEKRIIKVFFFSVILCSIIPAAITTQAPHAMRTYTMMPFLHMLSAYGLAYAYSRLKYKIFFVSVVSVIILQGMYGLYTGYFIRFPNEQSDSFQYALHKAVDFVRSGSYQKVVYDNRDNLYQSYMFYLFGTAYDPVLYQQSGGTVSGGYDKTHTIGNVLFEPVYSAKKPDTLYIVNAGRAIVGNVVAEFRDLDGTVKIHAMSL